MPATAVPEDHLMRYKFRVTGHMDGTGEIRRDGKTWLLSQDKRVRYSTATERGDEAR
jgi:hypothetical protein